MYSIPSAMPIWVRRCVFLSSRCVVLVRPFIYFGLTIHFSRKHHFLKVIITLVSSTKYLQSFFFFGFLKCDYNGEI
jgi:hypothetical protein